jgi:hypothetical protein
MAAPISGGEIFAYVMISLDADQSGNRRAARTFRRRRNPQEACASFAAAHCYAAAVSWHAGALAAPHDLQTTRRQLLGPARSTPTRSSFMTASAKRACLVHAAGSRQPKTTSTNLDVDQCQRTPRLLRVASIASSGGTMQSSLASSGQLHVYQAGERHGLESCRG